MLNDLYAKLVIYGCVKTVQFLKSIIVMNDRKCPKDHIIPGVPKNTKKFRMCHLIMGISLKRSIKQSSVRSTISNTLFVDSSMKQCATRILDFAPSLALDQ